MFHSLTPQETERVVLDAIASDYVRLQVWCSTSKMNILRVLSNLKEKMMIFLLMMSRNCLWTSGSAFLLFRASQHSWVVRQLWGSRERMHESEVFLDELWKEHRFSIFVENWNLNHNHHGASSNSIMFLLLILITRFKIRPSGKSPGATSFVLHESIWKRSRAW